MSAYYVLEFSRSVNSFKLNMNPATSVLLSSPFYQMEAEIRLRNLPKFKELVLKVKCKPRLTVPASPLL